MYRPRFGGGPPRAAGPSPGEAGRGAPAGPPPPVLKLVFDRPPDPGAGTTPPAGPPAPTGMYRPRYAAQAPEPAVQPEVPRKDAAGARGGEGGGGGGAGAKGAGPPNHKAAPPPPSPPRGYPPAPGTRRVPHLGDALHEPRAARQRVAQRSAEAAAVENDILLAVAVRYLDLAGAEARVEAVRLAEADVEAIVRLTIAQASAGQG